MSPAAVSDLGEPNLDQIYDCPAIGPQLVREEMERHCVILFAQICIEQIFMEPSSAHFFKRKGFVPEAQAGRPRGRGRRPRPSSAPAPVAMLKGLAWVSEG